jgi:signal transduction histidine kinase
MKSGVNRMMESIRRICTTLRPALLDELGLIPALEQLCADFTKSSGIPCSFDFNGLSTECRAVQHEICSTTIFRIVQESLNNSLKYARASHVAVSLRRNIGVTLEIRDDGCGFMLEAQTGSGSFGITGMRERAGSLGATLDIISTPGKGTRVKLVVPCSCQEKTQCVS